MLTWPEAWGTVGIALQLASPAQYRRAERLGRPRPQNDKLITSLDLNRSIMRTPVSDNVSRLLERMRLRLKPDLIMAQCYQVLTGAHLINNS